MSVEGTIKRFKSNKNVSAEAWYEYCLAKGYIDSKYNKNVHISALSRMKEHVQGSHNQARFLLHANLVIHDITLACNSDAIRNYIRLCIGDCTYGKGAKKYSGYEHYFTNIETQVGNFNNIDYLIDNGQYLLEKGIISALFTQWLKLVKMKFEVDTAMITGDAEIINLVPTLNLCLNDFDFTDWSTYAYRKFGRNKEDIRR